MKLKELTLLFVLALGTQVAFAQQSKSDPTVEFNPHWYGQIQGGVAHTVGETVFKDLLSPAGALSLGYQFNPTLGLRVGASGWQAKGNSIPIEVYKFNFLQGNVDLTFHLANLFGYNHKRVLDPYALIGGGAAFGFKNGANSVKAVKPAEYFAYLWDKSLISPVGRVGLGFDIRLAENVALNLEVNGNVLSDRFNSKKAGNPDYQYNALAGLKINFGKATRPSAKYLAELAAAEAAAAAEKARLEAERAAKLAAEKAAAEKAAAASSEYVLYDQLRGHLRRGSREAHPLHRLVESEPVREPLHRRPRRQGHGQQADQPETLRPARSCREGLPDRARYR